MIIKHGYKLKRGASKAEGKCFESIEVIIRDPDGKKVFNWAPSRGNLNQGIYETLDFVEKKLGITLNDVMIKGAGE